MERDSFWYLHDLIKNDPIFLSTGRKPQRPSWHQLATFLIRYGEDPAIKSAKIAGVSEGSVYNYCDRIAQAFRNIRPQHLSWPGQERRAFLKEEMTEYGFPGCIGIIDGTLIRLREKPLVDGEVYFCRKKFYAVCTKQECLQLFSQIHFFAAYRSSSLRSPLHIYRI